MRETGRGTARGRSALICVALLTCTGCGVQIVTVAPSSTAAPRQPETAVTRPAPPSSAAPPIGSPPPALSVPREPVTPDVSPVLLARAQSEFDAGRLDEAIALLDSKPRANYPTSKSSRLLRDAYNRRALTRYGADRIAEAIADMNRSLQIDPAQPEIRTQLARARERLDRLKALQ